MSGRTRFAIVNSQEYDAEAFTAFEAAGWAEQADAYHRFFASITTRVIDVLLDACGVAAGCRVLDIATGPGYVAAAAARRGAVVVGVDIAPRMLRIARGLFPDIDFRQSDMEHLALPDSSFDAVTGNFAILHAGRPERAVAEVARVLVPGGMVALSTWDAPQRCRLAGVFVDAVAEVGAPPPPAVPAGPAFFKFSDEAAFSGLLADAEAAVHRRAGGQDDHTAEVDASSARRAVRGLRLSGPSIA